ncbi:MAG TPA: alpha-2-macroglobulin family protein [Puia sp.]
MNLRNTLALLFCCLVSSLLNAQIRQGDYETKWKSIDSLVAKKGLVQSALTEVNKIYTLAKQEKNDAQVIRALLYRINLQGTTREDAAQSAIEDLEKEIAVAAQPARSILQSILAGTYWNYFQQHRWQLYNRTKTANFKKEDIATWDISDFHQKTGELYLSSLKEEKLLQETKLDRFDPILIKGNARALRPTLFDLLAHRALDYFKTDERDLNKPAYAFEIDDPVVFSDASAFTMHSFRTTDSLSLHFKALQLFQRLIRLHLPDPRPDALLDVDIERLNFANAYAVLNNKEDLYSQALARITNRYSNEPAAAEAWYLQARQYTSRAGSYDPLKDTTNRYGYVTAKAICEKVLAQGSGKDSSEGKTHCAMLLKNILRKELLLQTEKINVPGEPLRSLVSWRNFGQLYVRVIRADRSLKEGLGRNSWQDEYWKKLVQLPVLKTFSPSLPATGDYQSHRVEIKIDALPAGEYILLASSDKDFSLTQNPLAVQFFYVSSIAYINNDQDYFIVNRESGQPLAGAAVQVWDQHYDYKTSKNMLEQGATYQADSYGHFLLAKKNVLTGNEQQLLEISTTGDHLFLQDQPVNLYYYNEGEENTVNKVKYEKDNLTTFFFTDRSIYRPGQTLYFKGIVVTRDFDTRQVKALTAFKTKVILYDANRARIDSLDLGANEFGSYHGAFRLPENLLNGEFSIEDDSTGNTNFFSVEEYKRPKFYVEYEKLKGSYRVGDTVRVQGNAKAYAGNNIDGAVVKYRVLRKARYPYPWLYGRWRRPVATEGQEIAHGESKTDAEGKFTISFPALPDLHVNKELDPVFEYQVSADITDINGETRSGETTAFVGYKVLQLSIKRPAEDHMPADSLKELAVVPTNLSGEPEPATVQVAIYKLRSPDHLIRQRLWQEPDQFIIPEQEYRAAFPHDEYRDESRKESWEREEVPAAGFRLQTTEPATRYRLEGDNLKAGWYVIEARAKDKYGQEVKSLRYIELYDSRTGRPATPQYNWAVQLRETVEPGEKAGVDVGSSAGNLFVIRKVERDGGAREDKTGGKFSYLTLDKEKKKVEFPVTEVDRGGFGVSDVFIKDNRLYTNEHIVQVPWTNKELTIQYASFRDKTLPGSEEKWQVKIAGYKTDKVAAEVLASMYDASLDQFKMHTWSRPDPYPVYAPRGTWSSGNNFSFVQSQVKYINEPIGRMYLKSYDGILSVSGGKQIMLRGNAIAFDRAAAPQDMTLESGREITSDTAEYEMKAIKILNKNNEPNGSKELPSPNPPDQSPVQMRKDFKETAFFFPDLRTDSAGNISFSFTMPEALTRWKWMTLAHSRDLSFGYSEKTIITQKQLMVQPNAPRFLREGDRMELSAKIVNLTDSELTGRVELQLTDPTSGQTADGMFTNRQPNQYFTVGAGQSAVVSFPLDIPYQYSRPLSYRIVARASLPHPGGTKEEISDGEEATLPVVSNRMLVTESLPLNMPGDGRRAFTFDKLLRSGSSETLSHYALTVEFTSNPAWYAVQALPYLMEYPYDCAEQTFSRFYANALASKIANSSPRIQQLFNQWKTADTTALLSNLEKNQELKSVLLQETPWVLQGKSESQQKRNIALLFDMNRMSRELESSLDKLQGMQSPDGGFVWFKGGPDDRYITQYILTGIGHLQKLNALPPAAAAKIKAIVTAALPYLDKQIKKDYEELKKQNKNTPLNKNGWIGELAVQYLYMRSSFSEYGIPGDIFPAVNYYRKQAQQLWLQTSKYSQGMIALALYRTGDIRTAKEILASLQQTAIRDEEKGMYWKGMEGGYYWYQAPVETQSLLIEAFHEIGGNAAIGNALRTWLLKQKQTHNWATTKATADACYALLLDGGDWLHAEKNVEIRLGDKAVASTSAATGAVSEAGTGYFKKVFDGPFVNPSMGNITVTMSSRPGANGESPAWGAVYWQYFENLDRITPPGGSRAPLRLVKKIFVERNTDRGPVLEPVAENGTLHVGDKVKVRIELQVDRDLEYVHMKDMRASCMEPVNVLSGYKWQGGLGYYESTKDVSTDFFFSRLSRGTYIFEYPLFVGQVGNFSNGITGIECMYAPEFSFHSEGIRVNVE